MLSLVTRTIFVDLTVTWFGLLLLLSEHGSAASANRREDGYDERGEGQGQKRRGDRSGHVDLAVSVVGMRGNAPLVATASARSPLTQSIMELWCPVWQRDGRFVAHHNSMIGEAARVDGPPAPPSAKLLAFTL
ncbi:hypothetical protein [Micromonospora ureilytica]|uniref:hypothetical protein n=1 Tax=Micromonospora ureilytica TaxID=709868 RepID=UPI002E15C813|nr:hypothetical protein OHB55_12430 [Micromonospora ureilytica]